MDRDDGDSQDRRLLEENWMEAGREEEEATRCEGTWVFPTEELTDHHERITSRGLSITRALKILNMWSLDNVTCSYLENGISSPSLSGCKNTLPLSLNSDPLFVILCTQSLQSLVIAH